MSLGTVKYSRKYNLKESLCILWQLSHIPKVDRKDAYDKCQGIYEHGVAGTGTGVTPKSTDEPEMGGAV